MNTLGQVGCPAAGYTSKTGICQTDEKYRPAVEESAPYSRKSSFPATRLWRPYRLHELSVPSPQERVGLGENGWKQLQTRFADLLGKLLKSYCTQVFDSKRHQMNTGAVRFKKRQQK
jgi:hypothetical protein